MKDNVKIWTDVVITLIMVVVIVLIIPAVCSKENIRDAVQEIKQDVKYFWSDTDTLYTDADTFYTEWQNFDSIQYSIDTGIIYTHTIWIDNKPISFFDSCHVSKKRLP